MASSKLWSVWLVAASVFLFARLAAYADEKKEKELPPKGSLSSSGLLGTGSRAVDAPWGDEDVFKGGAPISGSVSKLSEREWLMRVFNNSKESYSVSLKVIQKDGSGRGLKTDHFSYSLKPGKSAERKLPASVGSIAADLELTSWRKAGGAPVKEEKEAAKPASGADASGQVMPDNYEQPSEGEDAE